MSGTIPILLVILVKYWGLTFKKSALIYGSVLLLTEIIKLIEVYFIFPKFSISVVLLNLLTGWLLPLAIFVITLKVIELAYQKKFNTK